MGGNQRTGPQPAHTLTPQGLSAIRLSMSCSKHLTHGHGFSTLSFAGPLLPSAQIMRVELFEHAGRGVGENVSNPAKLPAILLPAHVHAAANVPGCNHASFRFSMPRLGGFPGARVHTVQDAPLHHPQCSSVAVHRHLGARGISCTELHRAPRCRRTSLHRHRRCERVAPNPGTGGAVCL